MSVKNNINAVFFFSTPSLFVYVFFAACWLVNLAFFAVNRQQEREDICTVFAVDAPEERSLQPTVIILSEDGTATDYHVNRKPCVQNAALRFACYFGIVHDFFRSDIPCDINPETTKREIYRNLFFRPPPFIG